MPRKTAVGFISILLFFCALGNYAYSQNATVRISGKVVDNVSLKSIGDASVQVLPVEDSQTVDQKIGITTKRDGTFDLVFNFEVPFVLKVSHVSYYPKEMVVENREAGQNLAIELVPKVVVGEDLVITAELVTETELRNPVTIDKISAVDVQQLASFDVFDLVSTLREVDVATQSMTMQSVNTRGFNSSANKRFLQLTDGIDNRAPGLSFPIGNLLGLTDLDIASVEILPGPSSARFGSSALNGVLLMKSRDPFIDEGFSLQAKGGLNDFNLSGGTFFSASGSGMMDVQGRFAKAISDKIAFKLTGSHVRGIDWKATNFDNINFDGSISNNIEQKLPDNPAYNGVNIYGDESFSYLPLYTSNVGTDGNGRVSRTGYSESDLVNYEITTTRAAGSVHIKLLPETKIILDGRYGQTNSLYTGDSRIRLEGFSMYQGSVEFQSRNLNILGYSTWQDAGDSYDVANLSRKLISTAKSDVDWYRDFLFAFTRGIPLLGVPGGSLEEARKLADSGFTLLEASRENTRKRFEPGREEFEEQFNAIKNSTDPSVGAAIRDDSRLYHIQGTYKIPGIYEQTDLEVGGNYRFYDLISHGTIFPDTASNDISNFEFGGYVAVQNSLLDERLQLSSSLRIDKNENFATRFSPQVAATYQHNKKHYFRASFQNGFRYPGIREQFVNKNFGDKHLVGGLPEIVGQYNLQSNAVTEQAVDRFNEAVINDMNTSVASPDNFNRTQAELNNLSILESGIIKESELLSIKSERVNTFEIGYKRLFTPRIFLDLGYYMSFYNDFIGITRVIKPRTSPSVDLFSAANQVNSSLESDRLFIYGNARDRLIVQGLSFDLDYLSGEFLTSLNGSWTNLITSSEDPITPGFNTPPFKMNFEWGHRAIAPNVGFKMVFRLRTNYYWESTFLDGPIDTYGHFDFQFNVRMPSTKSMLKFGVSNIGIQEYYNMFGGPSVGSILFATFTYNPKSF